jgi:hypothetical protein
MRTAFEVKEREAARGKSLAKSQWSSAAGETPEEENPERGSWMKQASKACRGASRRERAKR